MQGYAASNVDSLTGVPCSYPPPPPWYPTVALCLGTYGGPRGVGVSYERAGWVFLFLLSEGVGVSGCF